MRILILLLLALTRIAGYAQRPLVVTDATKSSPVSPYTYFLEDISHQLTYKDVTRLPLDSFQLSSHKKIIQLGYKAGTVWMQFYVKNHTKTDLYLISSYRRYAIMDAYVVDESGHQTHNRFGYYLPSSAQQIMVNPPVIPLGRNPKKVMLRFEVNDAFGDYLHLGDLNQAFSYKQETHRWQSFALGAFLIVFFFALVFFIRFRDPLIGWYALLMLSLIVFFVDFYDYTSSYIHYGFLQRYIPTPFIYLQSWAVFHIKYLNLRQYSRILYWSVNLSIGIFWIDWPVSTIVKEISGQHFSLLYKVLYWAGIDWAGYILIVMLLLLISLVYVSIYRFQSIFLYTVAFLCSMVSMMVSLVALYGFEWLPFLPYNNAFVPGTLIEIIILGYVLGDQANGHRRQQYRTQQKLIIQLQENLKQKNKLLQLRDEIARDLHDEIGATLTSIAISTKLVQKKLGTRQNGIASILDQIQADSQETIHTIRDTVWALNPDNDSPEKLFERMQATGYQILAHQDITFTFSNRMLPEQLPAFSMEQRKNIYYVFREALHNITKHAHASQVDVQIADQPGLIQINIKDNGQGFDMSSASEGNGLMNFQKRAIEGAFTVIITSQPMQGTNVEVQIQKTLPELGI